MVFVLSTHIAICLNYRKQLQSLKSKWYRKMKLQMMQALHPCSDHCQEFTVQLQLHKILWFSMSLLLRGTTN